MSFPASSLMQDGLPVDQWCNLAQHARRWLSTALPRTFGTGSDAFTHSATGWSHAEAATITTAGVTAWRALVGDGQIKPAIPS